MTIIFDLDTVVCDADSAPKKDGKKNFDSILPHRGLVYALRFLERMGARYAFYTRLSEEREDSCLSFAERLFRVMPSCDHFLGMTYYVPDDCDVVVTSDSALARLTERPVIFMGKRDENGFTHHLMDCYSQFPSLYNDIST